MQAPKILVISEYKPLFQFILFRYSHISKYVLIQSQMRDGQYLLNIELIVSDVRC